MHEKFTTLLGKLSKLEQSIEVRFWDLVFQSVVSLRELLHHNLEDLALIDDTAKRAMNFMSN